MNLRGKSMMKATAAQNAKGALYPSLLSWLLLSHSPPVARPPPASSLITANQTRLSHYPHSAQQMAPLSCHLPKPAALSHACSSLPLSSQCQEAQACQVSPKHSQDPSLLISPPPSSQAPPIVPDHTTKCSITDIWRSTLSDLLRLPLFVFLPSLRVTHTKPVSPCLLCTPEVVPQT